MADYVGKRHDAKGRSTGEIVHYGGRAKRWKFEEAFVGEPMSLLEAPGYRALNFPALKILGFLKLEHVRHGGVENGRLMAPHRQLQALGISPRKIKPALAMLEAFGIVRCTSGGERQGGRPNAATYALTWLPTCDGSLPTEGYKSVTKADAQELLTLRFAEGFAERRKIAQAPTSEGGAPTQVKATRPEKAPTDYTSEGATAPTSEGTIYILGGSGAAKAEKPLSEPSIPEAAPTGDREGLAPSESPARTAIKSSLKRKRA